MKLLLVEMHDIIGVAATTAITLNFPCDVIKVKFYVGVGDNVDFSVRGVANEVNPNSYVMASPLITYTFDNTLGTVPLNMYEFCFTSISEIKFRGTVGGSMMSIEYYKYDR